MEVLGTGMFGKQALFGFKRKKSDSDADFDAMLPKRYSQIILENFFVLLFVK